MKEYEMTIKLNQPAPAFSLPDEKGKFHNLAEFKGKPIVLYFYPKDDTPGCTKEACNFRDDYGAYKNSGLEIIGISPDGSESHAKFKAKFNLPFLILADKDHNVCELYGVWGRKKFMGREYDGVFRTTFLIDREQKILRIFKDVKPAEHSREVLSEFQKLK
jgi:thioredoxin-dependent peroxiredoxin